MTDRLADQTLRESIESHGYVHATRNAAIDGRAHMYTLPEEREGGRLNDERSSQLKLPPWWLAFCALVSIAMIAAAWIKGGYIDEYYSISFADSAVPFWKAFDAWSKDPHPVGFYALDRVADLFLTRDLFIRRLTNLIYLVLALLVAWSAGKRQRSFGLLFIVSLAASPYIIERFAEYRSTFLGLMILAMVIIRLRLVVDERGRRSGWSLIPLLTAWLGFVDYPIAVPALALCGAWAALALKERDNKALFGATISGGVCVAALGLSIFNAARFHVPYDPYFESFPALLRDLAVVTVTAVAPCVAMAALALLQVFRERVPMVKAIVPTPFAGMLLLAILLTLIGFFVLNAATHALIRRQILGIIPLVVAYLTEVSLPHLKPRPITVLVIGANILLVCAASAVTLKSKRNFDRFGPEIARAQQSCPSLAVYGLLPEWVIRRHDNRFQMPDQYAIGLEDVARRRGFQVRLARPSGAWIDSRCGALLWSEALWLDRPPTTEFLASRLGLRMDAASLQAAKLEWVDQESRRQYSMLIRVPPPRR